MQYLKCVKTTSHKQGQPTEEVIPFEKEKALREKQIATPSPRRSHIIDKTAQITKNLTVTSSKMSGRSTKHMKFYCVYFVA